MRRPVADAGATCPDGRPTDEGVTLIEVLVGMGLFALLSTLMLGLTLSTQAATEHARDHVDVTEEARTALERMTRELRQSAGLQEVRLPGVNSADGSTSFRFWTDFNGDGAVTTSAADPEMLTYRWDPTTERLSLTALTDSTPETRPLLAAKVTEFVVELRSSDWEHDVDDGDPTTSPVKPDGTTTWIELDDAGVPVGNGNGVPDLELESIDLVALTLTVDDGDGSQTFRTQIDLRNRS